MTTKPKNDITFTGLFSADSIENPTNIEEYFKYFHQVFEADLKYKNILRDMKVLPGLYSIPVNIKSYYLAYNWLVHDRNKLFESLQIDYDMFIRNTNVDILMISKQLNKLNKHKLVKPLSVSERRSKIKNKKYVKLVKRFVNERINTKSKLYNDLKEVETLKFLIEKDIPKYIDMIDQGDKKLMRFLQNNCLFYNYPNYNWINFAKCFFDRHLEPVYIDLFTNYFSIYYNIVRHDIDIQDIINDFNKLSKNKQYRVWISFDIYLQKVDPTEDPNYITGAHYEIKRIFNQHDYYVKGNIISSVRNVRELKNLTIRTELEEYFFKKRPESKYKIIGTSMYVKIVPLNANIIGCRNFALPDYLINSKSVICFDKLNNNLCFWYCIAYYYTKRYDRCNQKVKELYTEAF